jgi:hypothetical protein
MNQSSPFHHLIRKVARIETREVSSVIGAFGLFFCMWAGYFAVRPVR